MKPTVEYDKKKSSRLQFILYIHLPNTHSLLHIHLIARLCFSNFTNFWNIGISNENVPNDLKVLSIYALHTTTETFSRCNLQFQCKTYIYSASYKSQ